MNLQQVGKLLRLTGPLIQLPSLWMLTQRPQFASRHLWLVYSLFYIGLAMVLLGLLLSFLQPRKTNR